MANGGDSDLEIKLKIDTAEALAKQAQVGKAFDKVAAQADAAAKKAAQSQFSAFDLQAKAARKLADDQAAAARRAAEAQAKAAKKALDEQLKAMNAVSLKAIVTEAAVRGIGNAYTAIASLAAQAGVEMVRAFAEAQKKINEYAVDLLKVKEDLKELATLRGLASASDEFVAKMAGFSRQTGLSIAQATEFHTQFYGSIAAGMQSGNIDEKTAERLAVESGKIASRQTKDYATRGDLAGIMAQFAKYAGKGGVEAAVSDIEAVRLGLTEGRGEDAPLTKSLLHVAGVLTGEGKMVGTLPEMAALIGVTSLSAGPGMADTRALQLGRAMMGSTPDQINFLKSIGITEGMNLEQRADILVPFLRQKKAEGRVLPEFIQEAGFNQEQREAIQEFEGNYEVFKIRAAKARQKASGQALMDESARQALLDPLQRGKVAAATLQEARLEAGKKGQDIQANLDLARAQLVASGRETSVVEQFGDWMRGLWTFGQVSGKDIRVESEARKMAIAGRPGVQPSGFTQVEDMLQQLPLGLGGPAAIFLQAMEAIFGTTQQELIDIQRDTLGELQRQNAWLQGQAKQIPPAKQMPKGRMGGAPVAP
jgi:hypothetical protein